MSATPPADPPLDGSDSSAGAILSETEARQMLAELLASSTADDAEAFVESRHSSLTRFANNQIHQNVTARDHAVVFRARIGRRSGVATTNRLDATALQATADRATALARLAPE